MSATIQLAQTLWAQGEIHRASDLAIGVSNRRTGPDTSRRWFMHIAFMHFYLSCAAIPSVPQSK